MTTDLDTAQQARQSAEVRALRMLRAGDSARDVSLAVGLSMDEIAKLRRDFPAPPTAVPAEPTPGQVDPIGRLLSQGAKHRTKRAQNLAAKITADVDRLRGLLAVTAEAEALRREKAEAKAAALAEVKRLEAQLRMAKDKLRAGKTRPPAPTTATGPKPCADCGKPVLREPGQMGTTPKRCKDCRG